MGWLSPVTDLAAILDARDAGAGRSATARALLLASLDGEDATDLPLGLRDARLLALRHAWFGASVDCLAECERCAETIEVGFDVRAIRAPAAAVGAVVTVAADGRDWRVRVPTSRDLLAAETRRTAAEARMVLLDRCLVEPEGTPDEAAALAIADAVAASDAQADVLLDVACPACGERAALPFDIAGHLWTELDRWADAMLDDVHALATAYGWSEADVLRLPATRRLAYLERVGRGPGEAL